MTSFTKAREEASKLGVTMRRYTPGSQEITIHPKGAGPTHPDCVRTYDIEEAISAAYALADRAEKRRRNAPDLLSASKPGPVVPKRTGAVVFLRDLRTGEITRTRYPADLRGLNMEELGYADGRARWLEQAACYLRDHINPATQLHVVYRNAVSWNAKAACRVTVLAAESDGAGRASIVNISVLISHFLEIDTDEIGYLILPMDSLGGQWAACRDMVYKLTHKLWPDTDGTSCMAWTFV